MTTRVLAAAALCAWSTISWAAEPSWAPDMLRTYRTTINKIMVAGDVITVDVNFKGNVLLKPATREHEALARAGDFCLFPAEDVNVKRAVMVITSGGKEYARVDCRDSVCSNTAYHVYPICQR